MSIVKSFIHKILWHCMDIHTDNVNDFRVDKDRFVYYKGTRLPLICVPGDKPISGSVERTIDSNYLGGSIFYCYTDGRVYRKREVLRIKYWPQKTNLDEYIKNSKKNLLFCNILKVGYIAVPHRIHLLGILGFKEHINAVTCKYVSKNKACKYTTYVI